MSPSSPRRGRGPRAIATMLGGVTASVRRRRGRMPAALFERWRDIVGADVAAQCCPERYVRVRDAGTLVIRVDGPVALELQHLAPQLIERLNSYLGYHAVHRISLYQGTMAQTNAIARPPRRDSRSDDEVESAEALDGSPLDAALAGLRRGVRRQARRDECRAAATIDR